MQCSFTIEMIQKYKKIGLRLTRITVKHRRPHFYGAQTEEIMNSSASDPAEDVDISCTLIDWESVCVVVTDYKRRIPSLLGLCRSAVDSQRRIRSHESAAGEELYAALVRPGSK